MNKYQSQKRLRGARPRPLWARRHPKKALQLPPEQLSDEADIHPLSPEQLSDEPDIRLFSSKYLNEEEFDFLLSKDDLSDEERAFLFPKAKLTITGEMRLRTKLRSYGSNKIRKLPPVRRTCNNDLKYPPIPEPIDSDLFSRSTGKKRSGRCWNCVNTETNMNRRCYGCNIPEDRKLQHLDEWNDMQDNFPEDSQSWKDTRYYLLEQLQGWKDMHCFLFGEIESLHTIDDSLTEDLEEWKTERSCHTGEIEGLQNLTAYSLQTISDYSLYQQTRHNI